MDTLKEQAIAYIRRSGLHDIADALIDLLRYSIRLNAYAMAEPDLEIGVSKLGGTPDLPLEMEWPEKQGMPLPFYAQIRCADLIAYDYDDILPHAGWLYFFYDALADDTQLSLQKLPKPDAWRVLYAPPETSQLQRTTAPPSLSEWDRYGCCAMTFSLAIMLPDVGSNRLAGLGLSYTDPTIAEAEKWEQYQSLTDQINNLSPDTHRVSHSHSVLGYPDEDGDRMELECEQRSLTSGWHEQKAARAELAWVLLLQIDTNVAARNGATHMENGDWLAIYFWIRREALLRRNFEQVWVLTNAD